MAPSRIWTLAGACVLCASLGCANSRDPATRDLGKAEVSVQSAERAPATETTGLEMKLARDKLERAKAAMADKDYEKADRLAEEANVDAELARVKAESEAAQNSASELEAAIQTVRGEAQRGARVP